MGESPLGAAKAYESTGRSWYPKDPEALASTEDNLDDILMTLRQAWVKGEPWTTAEIFGLITQNDARMLADETEPLDCALTLIDLSSLLAATAIRRLAEGEM